VIDHEARSPDGSKIVVKLGSQVSGFETGVWTADKQPVALLAKKWLDSASNSAAGDKR
jgi:hypothetical protein